MRNLSVLALLVALLSPVFAQGVTGNGQPVNWPLSTYRNVTQLQGTPVNPSNVTRFNWPAAGGGLFAEATVRIPQPNGQTLPVTARAPISAGAAASAIGRFVGRVAPPLVLASSVVQLARDLGITMTDESGALVMRKGDPLACTVSPCVEVMYFAGSPRASSWGAASSASALCAQSAARWDITNPQMVSGVAVPYTFDLIPLPASWPAPQCRVISQDGSVIGTSLPERRTVEPSSPVRVIPLTEFLSDIQGAPTAPSLPPALRDSIVGGESVTTDPPTSITGPTTTPGAVSTTINNTNNTTTTTTTTNNHTYNGPNVTTTTTTTLVTINNITNEVIRSETTTDEPLLPQPPPAPDPLPLPEPFEMPCGIAGTPPCGVKVDETGVNSDSSTVFDAAKSNIDEVEQAAKDALGDGGPARSIQAPQWSWTFSLPSGCSPYPLEPFGMSVDVCAFQDTIHDLMSLLWVGAGLFGLLGLLRSAFGE